MIAPEESYYRRREHLLLLVFLASRIYLLLTRWNTPVGFDWGMHVEMLEITHWLDPQPDIHAHFYAYHPPLSFLFPRLLMLIGVPAVASVQLFSWMMSLGTFVFLRFLLSHLRMLHTARGIVFLYLAASIPLQVYLSHSVNIDVFVLAATAATLYFSVSLAMPGSGDFWLKRSWERRTALVAALAFGMLSKFSGILALALPPIAALLYAPAAMRIEECKKAILCVFAALLLAAPYYGMRYYLPYGAIFPSNADIVEGDNQAIARQERDADPVGFIRGMFFPAKGDPSDLQSRDMGTARLEETWRDAWRKDSWLGAQEEPAKSVSAFYLFLMPLLALAGCISLFMKNDSPASWKKMGPLLAAFSVIQLFALIKYTYDFPWGGAVLMKGIYVAPMLWMFAYVVAHGLSIALHRPPADHAPQRSFEVIFLLLIVFTIINHMLPVY